MNKQERLEYQKAKRKANGNAYTKKYEKTKKGFLMRVYRNIYSRITGVQKLKYHLYAGKDLEFSKEEFYSWSLNNFVFHALFDIWQEQGHCMKQTPSVDRIDSMKGYSFDNIQWTTHSENSAKASKKRAS